MHERPQAAELRHTLGRVAQVVDTVPTSIWVFVIHGVFSYIGCAGGDPGVQYPKQT